jgi:hypothetical protein
MTVITIRGEIHSSKNSRKIFRANNGRTYVVNPSITLLPMMGNMRFMLANHVDDRCVMRFGDNYYRTIHTPPGSNPYWRFAEPLKALWRWLTGTIADAWNRRNNLWKRQS